MINRPTAASAPATSGRFENKSSISACGTLRMKTFSITILRPRPTMPVQAVATMTWIAKSFAIIGEEK